MKCLTAMAAVLAASSICAAPAFAAPKAVSPRSAAPAARTLPDIDIPYTKFVLPNGLTVIVHEDHKAPVVAVNIWYHVGSKNEPAGRTGFAHLFEHLMFNGSQNYNTDWFKALEKLGATDMNGTTNTDRTNYFETVPTAALDQVLWLESDRMGWLAGAIDQARLDEQRGVVQNEKRQGDNQPYAVARDIITESTYPRDHPYGHTVIGSMADLDAAKLDDVKDWFHKYYGPSNAVLVLAGDITPAQAREKVERYFGAIPSGPPVARQKAWIAKRTGSQRAEAQDRVPQARVYKIWNVPPSGAADTDYLSLLSDVLASDKTARLYKRLVYQDRIATSVTAYVSDGEVGSTFQAMVTAKPGVDPARIEAVLKEEFDRLIKDGPTVEELEKIRISRLSDFVRGAERVGGFGGKSDILAESQTFLGSPDAYRETLKRTREATPADLKGAGQRWLTDGDFTLVITPFAAKEGTLPATREKMPEPTQIAAPKFDRFQRAKLSNGMTVLFAQRKTVPTVNISMIVPIGGGEVDPAKPTLSGMTLGMMDEGAGKRDSLGISSELSRLGASLSTSGGLEYAYINLSAMTAKLDPSLDLMADVIERPTFPQAELDRLKAQDLANLQRSRQQAGSMAARVYAQKLYGPEHPYGRITTEAGINMITREDLTAFYGTWIKPQNATLVVVGDVSLEEITPKLEARFGSWRPTPPPTVKPIPAPAPVTTAIYLVDKPGSPQSTLIAAMPAPPRDEADERAVDMMNSVFGGAFVSRLNMNLREDKHWSYGAGSSITGANGPRGFIASTSVQTDKTKESLVEIRKELIDIAGKKPITAAELEQARDGEIRSLPGYWETGGAVLSSLSYIVTRKTPDTYWDTYVPGIEAVDVAAINAAGRKVVDPSKTIYVVVGDRAKIEKGLRELDFAKVIVVDADGKPVD